MPIDIEPFTPNQTSFFFQTVIVFSFIIFIFAFVLGWQVSMAIFFNSTTTA